jgi:aminobutyraldehyde dehydrogenase
VQAELLARLESANTGKTLMVPRGGVAQTIDTFRFLAGAARSINSQAAADCAPSTTTPVPNTSCPTNHR